MDPNLTKLRRSEAKLDQTEAKHVGGCKTHAILSKNMFWGRKLIKLSKATPHHQMGTKILAQESRTPCTQDFRYALLEKK